MKPHPSAPLFAADGVSKRYGEKVALDHVSFVIAQQRLVGLIGQNGSGKSTLLDIIAGISRPTEGTCATLGRDNGHLSDTDLGQLGVVTQDNRFLKWMRVEQHLRFFASFYPRWDVARQNALLKELDLPPQAKIGHLSTGNVQKLAIITAVCHHPRLLLLDEPVSALDPLARESILRLLTQLLEEDEVTIVISSHLLSDIERLVDWVLCLADGKLAANSGLLDLQRRFATWRIPHANCSATPAFAETFIRDQARQNGDWVLVVENAEHELPGFRERHRVSVKTEPMTLERMYPYLVKSRS